MSTRTYFRAATVISVCGVLFSGYLSGVRLVTKACAFHEPCPTFLGAPACYFGFVMFLALLGVSSVGWARESSAHWAVDANIGVSLLGTVFSGYFATAEIARWVREGVTAYGLGLSSCVYGAVFFLAILISSLLGRAGREPLSP